MSWMVEKAKVSTPTLSLCRDLDFHRTNPRQDARARSRLATVSRSNRGTDRQSFVPTIAAGRSVRSERVETVNRGGKPAGHGSR